jgi:hypothetical protein
MSLTTYITNRYEEKSELSMLQKQSQTKPIQSQNLLAVRGAKPNQTQFMVSLSNPSNPIYSEIAEPVSKSVSSAKTLTIGGFLRRICGIFCVL